MESQPPKFADASQAAKLISQLGDTFSVVQNPSYVFPPYAIYALASPKTELADGLLAVVMDMDGTTTTTETLCTGALDAMVRRFSGGEDAAATPALDIERDYPHIIGNSTTRHVEYLVRTYGDRFVPDALCRHFIAAVAWTLAHSLEPARAREAANALRSQGLAELLNDPRFETLCATMKENSADETIAARIDQLATSYRACLRMDSVTDRVRIGIEVYYQRYHESLRHIAARHGNRDRNAPPPIEPMPGIGVALALLKGWLGEDAASLGDLLAAHLRSMSDEREDAIAAGIKRLPRLGAHFAAHPVKIGLVTSSIAAEAEIVLSEVFAVIRREIDRWPLPQARRQRLKEQFAHPDMVYDARITASDASEIRLKPHRDLYAIALHDMGITPDQFQRVAGFEDSESGIIAMRAAGISLCCALPFAMTRNHRFEAATQLCAGGMPEVILLKNLFLP